jgi:hypothetical protein
MGSILGISGFSEECKFFDVFFPHRGHVLLPLSSDANPGDNFFESGSDFTQTVWSWIRILPY